MEGDAANHEQIRATGMVLYACMKHHSMEHSAVHGVGGTTVGFMGSSQTPKVTHNCQSVQNPLLQELSE